MAELTPQGLERLMDLAERLVESLESIAKALETTDTSFEDRDPYVPVLLRCISCRKYLWQNDTTRSIRCFTRDCPDNPAREYRAL